jgi:hypothetical protein
MIENLAVALIVAASAWYAGRRYVWRPKKAASGCGSGCSSCASCAEAPPAPAGRKTIKIHTA